MPENLRNFLELMSDEDARRVWDWLDGDPSAILLMIEQVVESHPRLKEVDRQEDEHEVL